jgi:hypothetical protein
MLHRIPRRTLLGGLTGACIAAHGVAAREPAGEVDTSRGKCYAQTSAMRRALAPAAELFIGDTVATGEQSAISLRLGSATQVKLGAEARLRIDRFVVNAGGLLVLDSGAMVYDHDPKADQGNVAVRVPFGLVAVRGTRFFAGPSNGVFGVFVERGEVMVVGANTAVTVAPSFGSDLAGAGAEPTVPHQWNAARIASAFASVS